MRKISLRRSALVTVTTLVTVLAGCVLPSAPAPLTAAWRPPPSALPATSTYAYFEGGNFAYADGSNRFGYTPQDAKLDVTQSGNLMSVSIRGDGWWDGSFAVPGSAAPSVGTYSGLSGYDPQNSTAGGLDVGGLGRGCRSDAGSSWFAVDDIAYASGTLQRLTLRFQIACQGSATVPAISGQIRYDAAANNAPPANPSPPAGPLWQPPAGALPATGNAGYLASDAGDFLGQGDTATFTYPGSYFGARMEGAAFSLNVAESSGYDWTAVLVPPDGQNLQPGYYGQLSQYPWGNPVRGSERVSVGSRGCNVETGWFAIDDIAYANGQVQRVSARFEVHCENAPAGLHGAFRYDASTPNPPVNPSTAAGPLWQPPPGAVPASGNYAYTSSEPGDWLGGGATALTTAPGSFAAITNGGLFFLFASDSSGARLSAHLNPPWGQELRPGYYGAVHRNPVGVQLRGAYDISVGSHGCNQESGWFVVDDVAIVNGQVQRIAARFEVHCENAASALHGAFRWQATSP